VTDRSGEPASSPQAPPYQPAFQPMPPPPELQPGYVAPAYDERVEPPSALRAVLVLLWVNLALSVVLTVVTVLARHSIVDYQLDHRHITDPAMRHALRASYSSAIIGRVVGNIVVSIVYVFLVRALLRGRRWAYRRVIWIGAAGIVGLVALQVTPYPPWMRAEQLVQAVVLALLLYFVLRPQVRAHFASGLPGRDVRRFNRPPRGS
jgi:hypothetical protein